MSREDRVYCGEPKGRLSATAPVKSGRGQIAPSTLQGAVKKVPCLDGPKFNRHAQRNRRDGSPILLDIRCHQGLAVASPIGLRCRESIS